MHPSYRPTPYELLTSPPPRINPNHTFDRSNFRLRLCFIEKRKKKQPLENTQEQLQIEYDQVTYMASLPEKIFKPLPFE